MIAIIPAAGIGSRFASDIPKQYTKIQQQPILAITIDRLLRHPNITKVVVAIAKDDSYFDKLSLSRGHVETCIGGASRAESVYLALQTLNDANCAPNQLVAIHDAVRPFFSDSLIDDLYKAASSNSAGAIAAAPVTDTVKQAAEMNQNDQLPVIAKTIDRNQIWLAQTPQVFAFKSILEAYQSAQDASALGRLTDEASAIELFGAGQPSLVASSARNLKITWPEDLLMAEILYKLEQAG